MILNIDIMANMHRNLLPHQECHMMRRRNEECRNDLHLTSAGVGQHSKLRPRDPPYNDQHYQTTGQGLIYRSSPAFPPRHFKHTINDLLPHGLAKSQRPVISDHYLTTTAQYHDRKQGSLPDYKRAGDSDKVLYIQEFAKKLNERRWRPPLTMGNQKSECQDQYQGLPVVEMKQPERGPKPFQLRQHDSNGPSKRMIPTTQNKGTAGKVYYAVDQQVLRKLDPYLTTSQATHRPFSSNELCGYPRKDVATYWDCEGYPKAWGHGTDNIQLVKNIGNKSMVDTMVFKTEITKQLKPNKGVHVPHSGINMSSEKAREVKVPPVPRSYAVRTVPIPLSYQTANSTYGTIPRSVQVLQKMQREPLNLSGYRTDPARNLEQVTVPLVQKVAAY
ncbi:hypothetical protein ACHWQZ_G003325 [Mnemiopsis leidyi]